MTYLQGFLLQVLIYAGLWIYDEYVGFLISLTMTAVVFGLMIFAYIAEWIEKSKVPKSYFRWMQLSVAAPLFVLILFSLIAQGDFEWLKE